MKKTDAEVLAELNSFIAARIQHYKKYETSYEKLGEKDGFSSVINSQIMFFERMHHEMFYIAAKIKKLQGEQNDA